jgi:hypothetical protein
MPSKPTMSTRLSRDPMPGTPLWDVDRRNLATMRERARKLDTLADRLPREILDTRTRVRDLELRLGMTPSYPAPTPHD